MRFGLILYGDLTMKSGGFLYDRLLVECLRSRGHEVEEVSLPWRAYGRGLADNFSLTLLRRLAALPADLLVQDELAHPSLFWLNVRLRRRAPRPVVAIIHHLRHQEERAPWQNRFYRWVERRYLNSVDALIYNSQDTRQSVERLLTAPKPCVVATPGGDRLSRRLSREEIISRAQRPGPGRILFLGNLIPRKGLHALIEALSPLPRETWRLAVVGSAEFDPAYARAIQAQVERQGLAGQVRFYGHRDDDELADLLAGSQVLAVPSSLEGFGIVYLEAMSFGLPVLAGGKGGAKELVTPGQNGFLADPGDVAGLRRHLSLLLTDRERLAAMSLAALARFQRHPTWAESMTRACRFLEECAGMKQ